MFLLAASLLLIWLVLDGRRIYIRYQQGNLAVIIPGLTVLGIINALSGLALAVAETGLSPLAVSAGLISINFAIVLDDLTSSDEPITLDRYAIRGGALTFVIGLFVLLEQS